MLKTEFTVNLTKTVFLNLNPIDYLLAVVGAE